MHHLRYFLLMNLFRSVLSSNCNVFSTTPGYRCFADKQVLYNITPTHHYSCRLNCIMNKRCLYALHHVVRNYCLVSNGPCLWLEPDTNYTVTVYKAKPAHEYVEWVPKTRLINAARKRDTCVSWGNEHRVGRANVQSNLLLGHGGSDTVYTVLNGGFTKSKASEWLDIQPGCKVAWITFTGGNPIPNIAVQGGYLYNSGTPQPIYVMGAVKIGGSCTTYGYYDPGTGRGYFEFRGVDECTKMYLAPVPLSIFRSNSKFDENSKHSSVQYTRPITTIFCTRHDSVTVVTCAKYRCDRSSIFETKAFWIFIEFRIRSKYA